MRLLTRILGVSSILLFAVGYVMKVNSYYGADNITVTGLLVFVAGFSPLFLREKLRQETRRDAKISYAVFFITCAALLTAPQLRILELKGGTELTYFALFAFMTYVVFFSRSQESRKLRIRKDRQLAAILFTDIAGYTQIMGKDEDAGLMAVERNRAIHKKWIARFRGKLLKEMGDGTIAIFYTVTEAVLCAIDIQKEVDKTKDFRVHMGVHIAEIVFTDTDAYGDGMNITSRIAGQANAGEICITEAVHQNIRNREELVIEDAGKLELKNVEQPLQIYRIKAR